MAAMGSSQLLAHARNLYDNPATGLSHGARQGWRHGFASGAEWMRLVMEQLRGCSLPAGDAPFQWLGLIKYGLCMAGFAACVLAAWLARAWPLALLGVPAFYAIEVQFLFLFPAAIDHPQHPFTANRRRVARAGGTFQRMATVIPIAASMLAGGPAGQGFVRSWALGCIAIVIWYEELEK
jgi:hypothetical protein